jgi:FixJ family two-component response regulator
MPDVTGPELVGRLSELRDEIPVLFMSGYADSQLLSRGVSEEAVGVLRKQFTSHELIRMVREALSPPGTPNLPG